MSDTTALRVHARVCPAQTEWEDVACKFMLMAADEIERLHAARDELRAALEWYADKENYVTGQDCPNALIDGGSLARRALEQSACPECRDELPSLNWRNGQPYSYCPECGREELHERPDDGLPTADDVRGILKAKP